MESTLNIVFIILYILSILNLGFGVLKLSACHGDPRGAVMARQGFIVALTIFMVTSVVMMFRLSIWLAVPLVLAVLIWVVPLMFCLYEEIEYKMDMWNKKSESIDRTE